MGLFTPDDRKRAEELAEGAAARPAATAETVVEEDLLSAGDAAARVYAAQALADAAAADPDVVLARADDLRGLLGDDEADVRSHAERGLWALAAYLRDRGEAALDRAESRLAAGDPDGAADALADARERFGRAEAVFEGGPSGDAVLAETIGVRTVDEAGEDRFTPLLEPGTDLPASAEWTFTTAQDNQQHLEMTVLHTAGEVSHERRLDPADEALADLHLQGLPPAPAGVPVLGVQADVDEDGAITAALVDRGTGKHVEQRAGTAAVSREEATPDATLPEDVAARLDDVAERVERAEAAEPVGPGPEPMGSGPGSADGGDSAEPDTDTPTEPDTDTPTEPDTDTPADGEWATGTDDDATAVTGPGKHSAPRSHAEEATGGGRPDGPSKRDVERVLEARDDLKRAIAAETDDPSVVRDGVEMTVRRLEKTDDELAASVRDALATVVDDDADDVAAVREQARTAVEQVDEVLADVGVGVVDPDPGEPSDTDRHHVVEKSPGDQPEDHVVAVEQTGFARDGTVRRPARVQVSDGTEPADASTDADPSPATDAAPDEVAEAMPGRTGGPAPESGAPAAEPMPGAVATGDGPTDDQTDHHQPTDDQTDHDRTDHDGESGGRAPGQVPGGPTLDVDHDGLTGREVIGRGGNADVYRATVGDDGATVAVKEPRFGGTLQRETVERFRKEAERWAELDDHDHVVDVVDYGEDPVPWIAMEHMDGGSLADRAGEFDLEQAVWTAVRVADAVLYAHRHGVAHLDLKPVNVLFRSAEGAWDVPKVGDWGLAKLMLDHSQSVEGYSPRYAAPEQLDDRYGTPGQVTDVYAVGAVVYELASGQPPFTGQLGRVVGKVVDEEPAPLSQVAPDVTAELESIVQRAMAKRPGERYEDVLPLREDLRSLLASLR
jgi:molecular chaperone GrpE (heat shock protein)/tRNA A-37 threonylcarbamoyl transferase component Bud32